MNKNVTPSPADKKPLMVALSVLAVAVAGSAREVGAQTLNCSQGIEFGTYAACGVANTATMAPDGGLTTSGCLSPMGGGLAGFCILTGIVGTTLITVAGPGTINSGGNSMVVDNFLLQVSGSPTAVPSIAISASPTSPNISFGIGATLHVGATQAGGSYTGIYTVNTNYP